MPSTAFKWTIRATTAWIKTVVLAINFCLWTRRSIYHLSEPFYGYGQDTASGLVGWLELLDQDTAVYFEPHLTIRFWPITPAPIMAF